MSKGAVAGVEKPPEDLVGAVLAGLARKWILLTRCSAMRMPAVLLQQNLCRRFPWPPGEPQPRHFLILQGFWTYVTCKRKSRAVARRDRPSCSARAAFPGLDKFAIVLLYHL